MLKITILSENHTYNSQLLAEHGLSCLIEVNRKRYLFDTGKSGLFIKNAKIINQNIVSLDGIIISHGHYDHMGGLMSYLEDFKAKVYASPGIFEERYSKKNTLHFIGSPFSQKEYEKSGVAFKFVEKPLQLDTGVFLTGPIPRLNEFEKVDDPFIIKTDKGLIADQVMDEQAMVISGDKGLIIITGCGHPGIINIINYAKKITGESNINAIFGGFHLRNISSERFKQTINLLEENQINTLIPLHCTGQKATAKLYQAFPQKVKFLSVGEEINFD